jgi:hypothetical protein
MASDDVAPDVVAGPVTEHTQANQHNLESPEPESPAQHSPEQADPASVAASDDYHPEADGDQQPETVPFRRTEVDPSVSEILRAEAARENALRQPAQPTDHADGDVSDDDEIADQNEEPRAVPRPKRVQVSKRELPRRGTDRQSRAAPDGLIESDSQMDQRRDLLPNIDDVTKKLGKQGEADDPTVAALGKRSKRKSRKEKKAAMTEGTGGNAFTRGFAVAMLIAVIGWMVYGQAGQIQRYVPELGPYLQSYVNGVNAARIWIDTQAGELIPR